MKRTWWLTIPILLAHVSAYATEQPISLQTVGISNGTLIVVGHSTPGATLLLESTGISTIADSNGIFAFSAVIHPANCLIAIQAGAVTLNAAVANCGKTGPIGPKGDLGDAGPPGLIGYERIKQTCDPSHLVTGYCYAACPTGKALFGGSCSGTQSISPRSGADPSTDSWRCSTDQTLTGNLISQAFCAAVSN